MNPWIPHLLRAGGGGGGPVLPPTGRTMLANLTSSLILDEGTGGPTWSRATKAWGFNELGYLEELASGCAFFGGARLVRNTVRTKSEDFSNAAWVKTNLTVTGTNVLVCSNSTADNSINQATDTSFPTILGQYFRYSIRAKRVAGGVSFVQIGGSSTSFGVTAFCTFSLVDGTYYAQSGVTANVTQISSDTYEFSVRLLCTATTPSSDVFYVSMQNGLSDTRKQLFVGDGIKSFELLRAWSVDVTNYDASYIPEYVSVGVVASPFFGAGIDGAKYFETDWQGAPIAAANLLKLRREASAINNLLWSRRMDQVISFAMSKWYASTAGADLVVNGTFDVDTTGWVASGATATIAVAAGALEITCTGVGYGAADAASVVTTGTKTLVLSCGSITSGASIALGDAGDFRKYGVYQSADVGTQRIFSISGDLKIALLTNSNVAGTKRSFDNISIKESTVQLTTATGLDGIANTATTLTATVADAIILQPTSGIASAARCASAYVKRKTGTGTISFTQDGGSTWTDITSQINSSTWSRVEITATLANPSVGFKLSTSGDAIDVDCVQNEAGAVATSPIVTTTAAVTRNADSLTYQTAGNIDFAVGTFYCEAQSNIQQFGRNAVKVGASYAGIGNTDLSTWRVYDGTATTVKTGLSDISTSARKRSNSWGPANTLLTGDGLVSTAGTFDGSFGDGATILIGDNLNGYIGHVAIYNYQMTDAELQAITT